MEDDEGPEISTKAVLRPRRPGENIKVAETVLKRRDRNLEAAAKRAQNIARTKQLKKEYEKGKLNIIRPETLIKQATLRKIDAQRVKTTKARPNRCKGPAPGKVLAVIRNGRPGGSASTRRILREINLPRRHLLTFMPNTKESLDQLALVKPFVMWGQPTFKVIHNLMQKKAIIADPEDTTKETVLNSNVLVEKHLGDLGLICTEDLSYEVDRCGKHFSQVMERLRPIPMGNSQKAVGMVWDRKLTFGNLGGGINDRVAELLGD